MDVTATNELTFAEIGTEFGIIVNGAVSRNDAQRLELFVQRPLGNGALHDICTVQVVHAIRSYYSALQLLRFTIGDIHMEISVRR